MGNSSEDADQLFPEFLEEDIFRIYSAAQAGFWFLTGCKFTAIADRYRRVVCDAEVACKIDKDVNERLAQGSTTVRTGPRTIFSAPRSNPSDPSNPSNPSYRSVRTSATTAGVSASGRNTPNGDVQSVVPSLPTTF